MKTFSGFCVRTLLCLSLLAGSALAEAASVSGRVQPRSAQPVQIMKAQGMGAVGVSIFNSGQGKKARTAKVQLIGKNIDMSALTHEELVAWYQEDKAPAGRNIFLAQTEADGSYAFTGVPAGDYYLVFILPDADDGYIHSADYRNLKEYLPEWEHFEMSVIGFGCGDAVRLTLREGQAAVVDYTAGSPFPARVK